MGKKIPLKENIQVHKKRRIRLRPKLGISLESIRNVIMYCTNSLKYFEDYKFSQLKILRISWMFKGTLITFPKHFIDLLCTVLVLSTKQKVVKEL